jgi:F-type H+-transporting ATPase subunit delta
MNPTDLTQELQAALHVRTVMDDESRHVARVYADALYRAASQQGRVDEVLGEFNALINEVFARAPELEVILATASISRERKETMLERIFQGRVSDIFFNFLKVVNAHERLDLLRNLAGAFRSLCEERSGRIEVQVRSAVALNDEQRDRLGHIVREVAAREPVLRETIDPALLGGLVIQVGDWVYDSSVRTRLDTIRNQLVERSSHGIQSGRDRFGS